MAETVLMRLLGSISKCPAGYWLFSDIITRASQKSREYGGALFPNNGVPTYPYVLKNLIDFLMYLEKAEMENMSYVRNFLREYLDIPTTTPADVSLPTLPREEDPGV